jgi:uncharacterized protein (TIGR02600 family)
MMFPFRCDPVEQSFLFRSRRRPGGAALVIVLAFLVLATVLVVAFFGTVTSEYGAAKMTADVEAGRQLAETTAQIVMGQIREATSRPGQAWASQPGMIRTYDNGGRSAAAYALYSASQMVRDLAGATFDPAADLPGATWMADRALWADLNFPVEGRGGSLSFPIIDPRAAGATAGGLPLVEGFSYDSSVVPGSVLPAGRGDGTARLPMPVRWIYVFRDGSLAVPSGGSGNLATFAAPGPVSTTANPIVGRIAFWTDDETCKLNVNTACGGVPWDTPIGSSGLEMLFARYQPAKNEFSRYPGHPASVSLAPALWSFLGMSSPTDTVFPSFTPNWNTTQPMVSGPTLAPAAEAFRDKLFPLIPRNTFGGSAMATKPTPEIRDGLSALAAVDSDRLFASADEILFGPDEISAQRGGNPVGLTADDVRTLGFFLTAQSRAPEVNLFNLPKICLWPLPDASRKSVANANAAAGDTRSAVDRLIAFCSTLAYDNATRTREYAFTRYDATSATNDFAATDSFGTANNQILYTYLETLLGRPLPGFGGSFSVRYGAAGTRQILGGTYDFIRSQINLLDTSHSASDSASAQNVDASFVSRYAYAANVSDSLALGGLSGLTGQVIPASLPAGVKGSGRFPVVSQVALAFIARAANQPPSSGNAMHPWLPSGQAYPTIDLDSDSRASAYDSSRPEKFHTHPGLRFLTLPATSGGTVFNLPNPRYRGPALAEFQTQVEPAFLMSFSLPGAGMPGYRQPFKVRVKGLQNLQVNGVPLFNSYDTQVTTVNPGSQVWQFHVSPAAWPTASAFVGNPVTVGSPSDSGQTLAFAGGAIEIELLNPKDDSVVKIFSLTFPAATFPTPLLPHALPADARALSSGHSFWSAAGTRPAFPPVRAADLPPSSLLTFNASADLSTTPNFPAASVSGYAAAKTRFSGGSALANLILPQWPVADDYRGKLSADTVRSLEVAFGDARLVGSLGTVPRDFFLPHRFYFDTKMRAAHSLRSFQYETQFDPLHGATLQYLTASSALPAVNLPGYGGGWNSSDPDPGNLWDVARGDDVQRLSYNYFVAGTSTKAERWPFAASTTEFDATKFAAYKNSDTSLSGVPDFPTVWSRGGDFTSGLPGLMDGAMLGKVDEGNNRMNYSGQNRGLYPYFNELASTAIVPVGPNLFSPNRQVPSPVVLGSIPSGYHPAFDSSAPRLADVTPWRTLLFAPNPVGQSHEALSEFSPGGGVTLAGKAPDFALLDFFWMPVVEPYAVSEPLSTAGKINMNTQIAPFTHIIRDTALRGAFRSTLVTAVPDKWINFKNAGGAGSGILSDLGGNSASINYANFRYPINADETLKQFQARFAGGDIFRSASEICSLWLYPDRRSVSDAPGPSWNASNSAIKSWWYDNPGTESKSVTGDNLREKPYATLYPLLTTKSNTYTVHFKVQTLQKVPGTAAGQWAEDRDRVTSEYQGSQTIERYVDPMDGKLIDFAVRTAASDPSLSDFYRFRVLTSKRFTP